MSVYKCKKCDLKTKYFNDIIRHINKKRSCIKNFICLELTNDEMLIMTLIPFVEKKQNVDFNKIKNYKYTYKNKSLLLEELSNIEKHKIKVCKYCGKNYNTIADLKKHIIIDCFEKTIESNNKKETSIDNLSVYNNSKIENNDNSKIENNDNSKIENNDHSITNTNNITNNITLNIQNPIPFDDNWDISKISESEKSKLMLSQIMYTHLLKEILKNNINLNVIIDKNKDFGIVYKNDLEKYIKMEINEIVDNSMEKLHKNLLDISEELKKNIFFDKYMLEYKDKDIKNKYQCYNNNKKTQEQVNNCVKDIFDDKKEDSYQMMKELLLNEDVQVIPEGY